MVKVNSMLNDQIQVQSDGGSITIVDTPIITRLIASLTDDPQAITRATDLIMRQLTLYSTIKEFDLNRLIFKTLKQLGYQQMAKSYYHRFLAREVQ